MAILSKSIRVNAIVRNILLSSNLFWICFNLRSSRRSWHPFSQEDAGGSQGACHQSRWSAMAMVLGSVLVLAWTLFWWLAWTLPWRQAWLVWKCVVLAPWSAGCWPDPGERRCRWVQWRGQGRHWISFHNEFLWQSLKYGMPGVERRLRLFRIFRCST